MPHSRDNLIGSLWMILAMAGFALEDASIKGAAQAMPVAQVLLIFGFGGMAVFGAWAAYRAQPVFTRDVLSKPMRIRAVFEICARLFYVLALTLTPLSSATAIMQATPIVVVLGAAIFFGENVGWRRWSAVVIGLLGVLLILKPTPSSFSPLSIFAVLGMLGFAGRDLASRAAPKSLSTAALGVFGFAAIVFAGGAFTIWDGPNFVAMDLRQCGLMALAVGAGVMGYSALMQAMRTGEVATVTPFRYTRLLFGLGLGVTLFGEQLDGQTLIGCAVVVASGLFLMWRGR
ncbi:DMT family transporter [Pelagimonas varians]|uniref:EamA-like transporter family protein n=1 Tax=Pelagimonas varians TaxID=696760 RepID=A0A238KDA8_9RHOB|nr:DMT family transporter [Pelagimonas varians]PYG29907.1 drug/metabolite transporter (DMT)-like permease [Pelagimonas varians]SMX40799.1 EamA-like transporter family protein [Pelagimonas varians]